AEKWRHWIKQIQHAASEAVSTASRGDPPAQSFNQCFPKTITEKDARTLTRMLHAARGVTFDDRGVGRQAKWAKPAFYRVRSPTDTGHPFAPAAGVAENSVLPGSQAKRRKRQKWRLRDQ
ncbi:MAG TPA: hypothetical protein PKY22_10275, partial [Accumulibacter sp.]|nr:hypothetical protein [Accumulibacter sp.]